MSKWTPGPWEIGTICDKSGWVDIIASHLEVPKTLVSTRLQPFAVNVANARLIAAAPEMAELLAESKSMLDVAEFPEAADLVQRLRAILERINK